MLAARQRTKRLRVLIKRLKAGGTVTLRDLRAVLTADEQADYKTGWQETKAFNDDQRTTPQELKGYFDLLRSADAVTQRAETMSDKGKGSRATELYEQAEAGYERAYESLDEAMTVNVGLAAYLDRAVSFTAKNSPSLTAEAVPRLRAGRSKNKQGGNYKAATKRDLKLTALENTLAELTKTAKQKRKELAAEKARKKAMKERLARARKRRG